MELVNRSHSNVFTGAPNAETVIINTCGFIEAAKEESINTILEAVAMKNSGKIKKVIVAGCLSERYKEDLLKEIPEVDVYFGTENYEGIIKELGGNLKKELLGERLLTTPSHTAYLKISEGCDHPCSFCAIPLMRGLHKSKPLDELIREAEFGQSRPDFISKMSIALKEANETEYWLSILKDTDYIEPKLFDSLQSDCKELIAMLVSTVKTSKTKNEK